MLPSDAPVMFIVEHRRVIIYLVGDTQVCMTGFKVY